MQDTEISIVVPSLNEELTIGQFVDWCSEGLEKAGIKNGQILIIDSSTDRTAEIAEQHGAEVLRVPQRGLGRAYIDAIPHIRGKYVIMGDADATYDFRQLSPFHEKFSEGYEFIMGSRFKGSIEKHAMPFSHQYFGSPVTTWILNRFYGTNYSDIHCGMRGLTKGALVRMDLHSNSWQYASEMIIKANQLRLRTTEVPISFHIAPAGRESHLKRAGWFSSWAAGWMTLKTIMLYKADFFLLNPGLLLLLLGLAGMAASYNGPWTIGPITFSLHWMLLSMICALLGAQFVFLGIISKTIYDAERQFIPKIEKWFNLNIGFSSFCVFLVLGCLNVSGLLALYVEEHLRLPATIGVESFHAVAGLGMMFFGTIYFTSSLIFNAVVLYKKRQ